MSLIVNDDTGSQNKENLDATLKAYKKYPYGLLPGGKRIPDRTLCRMDVDHEQVARHETMLPEKLKPSNRMVQRFIERGLELACEPFNTPLPPVRLSWPVRFWRWLEGLRWPWERRRG